MKILLLWVLIIVIYQIPGIGDVTQEKLKKAGILTTTDLQQTSINVLSSVLGRFPNKIKNFSLGIDYSPVVATG